MKVLLFIAGFLYLIIILFGIINKDNRIALKVYKYRHLKLFKVNEKKEKRYIKNIDNTDELLNKIRDNYSGLDIKSLKNKMYILKNELNINTMPNHWGILNPFFLILFTYVIYRSLIELEAIKLKMSMINRTVLSMDEIKEKTIPLLDNIRRILSNIDYAGMYILVGYLFILAILEMYMKYRHIAKDNYHRMCIDVIEETINMKEKDKERKVYRKNKRFRGSRIFRL